MATTALIEKTSGGNVVRLYQAPRTKLRFSVTVNGLLEASFQHKADADEFFDKVYSRLRRQQATRMDGRR